MAGRASERVLRPGSRNPLHDSSSRSTVRPLDIFYRIIHPEYIQDGNLRLPSQFSREFGEELSRTATVVSFADGGDWEIRVKKVSEEDIFLEKGWTEFMEAHAIGVWYFVVFEYLGGSVFRVVQIFDRTTRACLHGSGDAQYSTGNNNNNQQQEKAEEEEEEEFLGSSSGSLKPTSAQEKNRLTNEKAEEDETELLISTLAAKGAHISQTISLRNSAGSGILTAESNRLLEKMKASELQHPCFLVAIDQFDRVVTSGSVVPTTFVREYMPGLRRRKRNCSENEDVELWDGGRERWTVRICADSSGCFHLTKGWCEFYRENSLKEGDICLFELLGTKPALLKASIFRVSPQYIKKKDGWSSMSNLASY